MRTKKPSTTVPSSSKKTYKRRAAKPSDIDTYLTIDGRAYKDPRLKDFNIKALYCRIKMYCNLKPGNSCFATIKTLSEYIGKSPAWVSAKIALLIKLDYIYQEQVDGIRHLKIRRPPSKNEMALPIYKNKEVLKNKDIYPKTSDSSDGQNLPVKRLFEQRHENFGKRHYRIMKNTHPNLMKPIPVSSIQKGAAELAKLERIDKYSWQDIKDTLLWSTKDSFWSNKILSLASLRTKSRNKQTKFHNLFVRYLESTNQDSPSLESKIPVKYQKVIEMIQKEYASFSTTKLSQLLPKMEKAYKKLSRAPGELRDFHYFVWQFIKFLKKQDWIKDPHVANFRPNGPTWDLFEGYLEENQMIM